MSEPIKTPAEWLPLLAARLDARHVSPDSEKYVGGGKAVESADARPSMGRLRRYARGKSDLPEMGPNLRASWQAFQKKARTDYGGAALRSLRNRIRPHGIRIGTSEDHPALPIARRVWRNNRLTVQFREAIRDYLELGVGYVTVALDEAGEVVVTRERPEVFYALPDPLVEWRARAALKVWRDDIAGLDYARVLAPAEPDAAGVRQWAAQRFVRPSKGDNGALRGSASGGWEPLDDEPILYGFGIGVVILDRGDDGPVLEPHLDVIDRINLGKLNRLVVAAMQAFRQRALKPKDDADGLPDEDEDGNAIDWGRTFEPAPGALWELPAGIDIWESQQTDWRQMLEAETQDARDFCAVTGTPISVLIPEGQNQSAEGAANAKEQQISQAGDDIERIAPALAGVFVQALEAAGATLGDDTVEVLFAPPEHVSPSERYAAAVQAKAAGLASRTIKRRILGMTPDEIRQDETDAGTDLLAAALMGAPDAAAPTSPRAASPVTQPDDA